MIRQSCLSRTRGIAFAAATAALAVPFLATTGSAQATPATTAFTASASAPTSASALPPASAPAPAHALASAHAPESAHAPASALAPARLTCAARTAPNHPITLTPPLRDAAPQPTKGQGVILFENCTSPSGAITDVASGRMEVSGTAVASCRGVADLSGSGTVTWRDAQGKVTGTSKLSAKHPGSATPADNLLQGDVVSGRLNGRHFEGTGTMTSDLRQCTAPSGFTQLTGSGRISFA
ncbi:hypothetical protein LDL08_08975 [Nonomuraea glycinis]|nr:hypothetical protein [Nonomuraea glycinis]MCA2176314.1 hypothetical protein [Nonomuraea glycinis]